MGKSMTLPPWCRMEQVSSHSGAPRRRALHEEALAVDAVGIALHDHGAIAKVGQELRCHVDVVLEQVALGEAERGPEDLVEVGELP